MSEYITNEAVEAVAAKAFQKAEGVRWENTSEGSRRKWRERYRHQMEAMARAERKKDFKEAGNDAPKAVAEFMEQRRDSPEFREALEATYRVAGIEPPIEGPGMNSAHPPPMPRSWQPSPACRLVRPKESAS